MCMTGWSAGFRGGSLPLALLLGCLALAQPGSALAQGGAVPSCLETARTVVDLAEIISGETRLPDGTAVPDGEIWFGRSGPIGISDGTAIDARGATIVVPALEASRPARRWYPLTVGEGLRSICIVGGDYLGMLSPGIGWHDSKGGSPGAVGANSAAIMFASADTTVTGVHISNSHDGIRARKGQATASRDWRIEHSWVEYNRDDCVDAVGSRGSGTIRDSLFDGCYVGISVRIPNPFDRTGHVITFDRVLMRMEPMPFPYRWWERHRGSLIYMPSYDRPIEMDGRRSEQGVPFGHGPIFKLNSEPMHNPRFVLKDSIFLVQQFYGRVFLRLPPDELIAGCRNVTVVWAGAESLDDFRARFDIPAACAGQVRITDDISVWTSAVADWHRRHPEVGRRHKPSRMGDIRIPRWDPQPWPEHHTARE